MKPSPSDLSKTNEALRGIEQSLPIALLRTRETVMQRFRPHLANHNLTEQKWRVIRTVAEAGQLEATQVSEISCILMPSLSRILKNLEEEGYLERARSANDARRQRIQLTQSGQELFDKMAPKSAEIYKQIEAECGSENIEFLLSALQNIRAKLTT